MRGFQLLFLLLFTSSLHAQLWRSVSPLIGSEGPGRVFVGPSAPFGMVKPGPDCLSMPNAGWAPMPEPVKGFSQTHVSGTGGGQKYGNVLIQPFRHHESMTPQRLLLPDGQVVVVPAFLHHRNYEKVTLGMYSCKFEDGIWADVTTAARCAVYRFRYADGLLVDAASFLGMDTIPNKRETQQYVASNISVSGQQ
jgi:putative alpha-1,2-mannosidase